MASALDWLFTNSATDSGSDKASSASPRIPPDRLYTELWTTAQECLTQEQDGNKNISVMHLMRLMNSKLAHRYGSDSVSVGAKLVQDLLINQIGQPSNVCDGISEIRFSQMEHGLSSLKNAVTLQQATCNKDLRQVKNSIASLTNLVETMAGAVQVLTSGVLSLPMQVKPELIDPLDDFKPHHTDNFTPLHNSSGYGNGSKIGSSISSFSSRKRRLAPTLAPGQPRKLSKYQRPNPNKNLSTSAKSLTNQQLEQFISEEHYENNNFILHQSTTNHTRGVNLGDNTESGSVCNDHCAVTSIESDEDNTEIIEVKIDSIPDRLCIAEEDQQSPGSAENSLHEDAFSDHSGIISGMEATIDNVVLNGGKLDELSLYSKQSPFTKALDLPRKMHACTHRCYTLNRRRTPLPTTAEDSYVLGGPNPPIPADESPTSYIVSFQQLIAIVERARNVCKEPAREVTIKLMNMFYDKDEMAVCSLSGLPRRYMNRCYAKEPLCWLRLKTLLSELRVHFPEIYVGDRADDCPKEIKCWIGNLLRIAYHKSDIETRRLSVV